LLGQLRPAGRVRFVEVIPEEAMAAYQLKRNELKRYLAMWQFSSG